MIRLIKPWLVIRVGRINATNFGVFVIAPAVYYLKKKLKADQLKSKNIDLLYIHHNDKIYNKQLAKMWKRKLHDNSNRMEKEIKFSF